MTWGAVPSGLSPMACYPMPQPRGACAQAPGTGSWQQAWQHPSRFSCQVPHGNGHDPGECSGGLLAVQRQLPCGLESCRTPSVPKALLIPLCFSASVRALRGLLLGVSVGGCVGSAPHGDVLGSCLHPAGTTQGKTASLT